MRKLTGFAAFAGEYIDELSLCLEQLDRQKVEEVISVLIEAYKNKKKIFIMGNGGSAGNASHLACDLSKGTLSRVYDKTEPRFRVYSLTDNFPLISALANDLAYEDIFVQQLRNLIEANDVVIVMSGSGNSKNLIKAITYAKKCKAKTIGFLGFRQGGKLGKTVDLPIIVNSKSYGICEDVQLIMSHVITSWIGKIKQSHDRKNIRSI